MSQKFVKDRAHNRYPAYCCEDIDKIMQEKETELQAAKTAAESAAAAAGEAKTAAENAQTSLSAHNTNTSAHADLRTELQALSNRINAVLDSDDETLDELSEIVAYIKSNKTLIDSITISKVNVSDIVNDLITNVTNKPLSAAQGVELKGLIDTLQSEFNTLKNSAVSVLSGTAAPTNDIGKDGDIYLITE